MNPLFRAIDEKDISEITILAGCVNQEGLWDAMDYCEETLKEDADIQKQILGVLQKEFDILEKELDELDKQTDQMEIKN